MASEAFVYCWTDLSNHKLYVGVHKGRQDDGYVCTQKQFNLLYELSPNNFTRQIIAEGSFPDCLSLEAAILSSVNAYKNPNYYNKSNGGKNWYLVSHSEETKNKLAKAASRQWLGVPKTDDHKRKISNAHMGKIKIHTAETNKRTKSTAIVFEGIRYYSIREAMRMTGRSNTYITKQGIRV